MDAQHLGEPELALAWPLHAALLDEQATLLAEASRKLTTIIRGLKPDKQRMERLARASTALTAALTPLLGYEKTRELTHLIQQGHTLQQALQKLGIPQHQAREAAKRIEHALTHAAETACKQTTQTKPSTRQQ